MERLTKRNDKGIAILNIRCPEGCEHATCSPEEGYQCQHQCERDIINKLAIYEDAEEQGLLLRLLCKVGDTVYAFLSTYNYFTECQIKKIELKHTVYGNTCYFLEPIYHRGCLYRYFKDDFGKTVFLTKEKVKIKLKEMEKNNND